MPTFPITDIPSAMRSMQTYLAYAAGRLPDDTWTKLDGIVHSPVVPEAVSQTVELLYARRDEIDDTGRAFVASLASFGAVWGWYGLGEGNRGGLISLSMRRDAGEAVPPGQPPFPAPADDPGAAQQYLRAAEAPPAPPPVVQPPAAKADEAA